MISFVLGNGKSRQQFNVTHYRQYGKIYGCNAIYRDEDVDYLIAVDPPMAQEVIDNNAHLSTTFYTRDHKRFRGIENVNFPSKHLGWSSGPTALWIASKNLPSVIFIAGFDFASADEKLNNIYGSTTNYKAEDSPATYFGNWIKQTEIIIRDNPSIQYYRITTSEHNFSPKEYYRYKNFSNISYEKMDEKLKTIRFEPIS
jgi:hypothetical protein